MRACCPMLSGRPDAVTFRTDAVTFRTVVADRARECDRTAKRGRSLENSATKHVVQWLHAAQASDARPGQARRLMGERCERIGVTEVGR